MVIINADPLFKEFMRLLMEGIQCIMANEDLNGNCINENAHHEFKNAYYMGRYLRRRSPILLTHYFGSTQ